jgi:hypothetical protein
MKELQTPIPTDTWVTASWDEYIQLVSNSFRSDEGRSQTVRDYAT